MNHAPLNVGANISLLHMPNPRLVTHKSSMSMQPNQWCPVQYKDHTPHGLGSSSQASGWYSILIAWSVQVAAGNLKRFTINPISNIQQRPSESRRIQAQKVEV